jgi:NADH-quinone oxidoreductase subunit K
MLRIENILYITNRDLVPMITCLNFSVSLFIIGLVGIVWNKRNFITVLICIELMFFSIGLNFVIFSVYTHNLSGEILTLLVITSAASETAIGLSILVVAYRLINGSLHIVFFNIFLLRLILIILYSLVL